MQNYKTQFYGINVTEDRGHWYIVTADGGDWYIGTKRPTRADIDRFRADNYPETCTQAELESALPEMRV